MPQPTPDNPGPTPPIPVGLVRINEVAWAGTQASAFDEWMELFNTGPDPVDLTGWRLTDGGDVDVTLQGALPGHGFYLLERTDDQPVADVPANLIYTGGLNNAGESLRLLDPSGRTIDTANAGGGSWPAGAASPRASMARQAAPDQPSSWFTSTTTGQQHDAAGDAILGSPGGPNGTHSTPTPSDTPSPTASAESASPTPTSVALIINEIAWAGTRASSSDEWIELFNPNESEVVLDGWRLTDHGDIDVPLSGRIEARGFYVLERTDDQTVVDRPADMIYTGSLANSGEILALLGPNGDAVDRANRGGGGWPAGNAERRYSMERRDEDISREHWSTFTGYFGYGHDAAGSRINGTPGRPNSSLFPTPTPTWIPGAVVINEVLIRPHYDWEGTGGVDTHDEFIELYNRGPHDVNLGGWWLDDISGSGSRPHDLPNVTIPAEGFAVFFRTYSHIALNDSGDSVRLLAPNGHMIDKISYLRVRAYNLSYGRLPDGSNQLAYGLWPTPGEANLLFVEATRSPTPSPTPLPSALCPSGGLPWPRQPRLAWQPGWVRWMLQMGSAVCR